MPGLICATGGWEQMGRSDKNSLERIRAAKHIKNLIPKLVLESKALSQHKHLAVAIGAQ